MFFVPEICSLLNKQITSAMACPARMKAAMRASAATRCLIGQVLLDGMPTPGWALRCRLLDHLIRPLQERRRDREAEGLGGLEVDDELELGGLLDGKVAGFRALEDAVDVSCGSSKVVRDVRSVCEQSTSRNEVALGVDRRQPISGRQRDDP